MVSSFVLLIPARENPLQRDDLIDDEERLPVFVGLASADVRDRCWLERGQIRRPAVRRCADCGGNVLAGRRCRLDEGRIRGLRRRLREVVMRRHLAGDDGVGLLATGLTEGELRSRTDRHAAAAIRQREGRLTIAAIGGSQKRKEGLILVDWQELAVALRPPRWSEVEAYKAHLGHKRRRHAVTSFFLSRFIFCGPARGTDVYIG